MLVLDRGSPEDRTMPSVSQQAHLRRVDCPEETFTDSDSFKENKSGGDAIDSKQSKYMNMRLFYC